MKFDELYCKLLKEMDVASVYGDAAADGDLSTGWTADGDVYAAMSIFGGVKQDSKKSKKRKKKPKIQKRPKIGTM